MMSPQSNTRASRVWAFGPVADAGLEPVHLFTSTSDFERALTLAAPAADAPSHAELQPLSIWMPPEAAQEARQEWPMCFPRRLADPPPLVPKDLVPAILRFLPPSAILAFGRTSRHNRAAIRAHPVLDRFFEAAQAFMLAHLRLQDRIEYADADTFPRWRIEPPTSVDPLAALAFAALALAHACCRRRAASAATGAFEGRWLEDREAFPPARIECERASMALMVANQELSVMFSRVNARRPPSAPSEIALRILVDVKITFEHGLVFPDSP